MSFAASNRPALPADKFKNASTDALRAFKTLASDPVGGLSSAFESLGQDRALGVGMIFGALFALGVLLGVYRLVPVWGRPQGFGGFMRILVVAVVPFLSLLGATALARMAFRGNGGFGHDSFIAGTSLLPFGLGAIVAGILGFGNMEVVAVLALFALCLNILIIFTGLTRISKVSEQSATIAVPLMFLASAWLSKIIYSAML
jgi:hypothetical protein